MSSLLWLGRESWSHNISSISPPNLLWQPPNLAPGSRLKTTAALVPVQIPGTPLSQHNLTVCFSTSSTILASKLHISWDSVGCSLFSSEDSLGVPVWLRDKWAPIPPTLPPSSPFVSFYSLITVARTYTTILNKSGERIHPSFVPDLKENSFVFLLLNMMFAFIFL